MIYVTRSATFSASHRLFNPTFSDERNIEVFDKCNNLLGHGHNYRLDVTVRGLPDAETGYVIDLKKLKAIMETVVIDKVDHKHLNYDVGFLQGIIPTVENLCVLFWRELERVLPVGSLHSVKLWESEQNVAEYFGEPVTIPVFDVSRQSQTNTPIIV
jgi:6-pyruvoyltetrahydropterin/6-carboxytetrahydropterin synthase